MTLSPQPFRRNTSDQPICGPHDIIASIPGILGYYPQESAIVVSLLDDASGAILLGPVVRTDLAHVDSLTGVLEQIPTEGVRAHLGLVVSRIPNSELVRDAVDALYAVADAEDRPLIDACWHVSEIATGTPYTMVFGPAPSELGCCELNPEWITGTVSSVMAQATMEPLLAQGALPELERDDTRAYFDLATDPDWPQTRAAMAMAHRRGQEMLEGACAHAGACLDAARADLERAADLLRKAASRPFLESAGQAGLSDLFASRDDVELVAAVLSHSRLRDCLLRPALENPAGAGALLVAVARNFEGAIRANALSIWAIVAVQLQLTAWAGVAVECAQEELPGHSLSHILGQLLRNGQYEGMIATALRGCDDMWEEIYR